MMAKAFIAGQNDVGAIRQRVPIGKALQGLAAHNNHMSGGGSAEELHILRNADKELALVADAPVAVHSYN